MDDVLRAEIAALQERHRLSPEAAADLLLLLDKALDSRFAATAAPPPPPEAAGAREGDAGWEDLGLLGRGSMGEVRRVLDPVLQREVALKKLIRPEAAGWFAREVRILASLEHPGVVPVFQAGRLPDGTPWFAMRRVQGRTLEETLAAPPPERWSLRWRVEILRRVADTLGYAHERGIIHRDVKPANVLLGERGEVMVVDWGLALQAGEGSGRPSGTPAYMAPEQHRGAPAAPAGDVWSLGVILFELIAGRPCRPGEAPGALAGRCPPALAEICARCLVAEPAARLPDGVAVSRALADWLEDARRGEEARAALERALALRADSARLLAEATRLRERASAHLAALEPWRPEADKRPGWDLEDEAAALALEARLQEEAHLDLLQVALERAPLPEVHAALSGWHYDRFCEAHAARDPARVAVAHRRLAAIDLPRLQAWEAATGALTLLTDPPGAHVRARPYARDGRRLVPGAPLDLGVTPLRAVALPAGSWLLELSAPGRAPVRYPVQVDRFEHWDGIPPGADAPRPVYLPRSEELGPQDHYVPAGWCRLGVDLLSPLAAAPGRAWVDGFVVRRYSLANRELVDLFNRLAAQGRAEQALAMAPRERGTGPASAGVHIYAFDGQRFSLKEDHDGDLWLPDWPVMMVDFDDSCAICAAFAEEDGLPWRLPSAPEFEKAGRGVDGRAFPWGDFIDPSFSCRMLSQPGRPAPVSVLGFPLDESPYGIRGLYGTIRTWTATAVGNLFLQKGSYYNAHGGGHLAFGFKNHAHFRGVDTGLRLVRSLGNP